MSPSREEDTVKILSEVIAQRRSVRSFSEAMPPRKDLERIIAAGLAAPYAAAMSPGEHSTGASSCSRPPAAP